MYRLPALPFGNANAKVAPDARVAADTWATMVPAICTLDEDRHVPFAAKVAARRVGDLDVITAALTTAKVKVEETKGWQLIIPFHGYGTMRGDRTTLAFEGGCQGLLMPNLRRTTDCTSQMIVTANVTIAKLRETASAMMGDGSGQARIDDRPYALDMRRQREIFPAFQQLCSLIETTSGNPHYARILGIEDAMYRWTIHALALLPQDAESALKVSRDRHRIDVVCDLVRTSHDRPLTLTEMERLSGLSARALQYAFKARFGCSPMEWQRRERMQLARSRLMFPAAGDTITDIAYAMGFSSSAAFTSQYRRYFGETPSTTRGRAERS
ncbi:AraC family transcriptional regulator [Novosphingobium sp.]|uniref:helix-turn-helix transcriptional regulator n=1 Tax=Novosphingobium sp. TaxID=1874826 RepID=UPI001DE77FFE|nr:AraC family transcriptional regulator [Novosphingobium sp.]MBX9662174.1 AraC family transcriptional regulator [Novosphingobium sp.]